MKASVILPCLNEEDAIGGVVADILEVVRGMHMPISIHQVLVVDNGSTDRTAQVARAAGANVVSESRRGYGRACLTGAEAATDSDLIVLMDGDGSDVFADLPLLLQPLLDDQADLIIGSRVEQAESGSFTPQQQFGNAVATRLFSGVYGLTLTDNGPFRVIRREHLLNLGMTEMTYGWSIEMTARAHRAGLRVLEVPVRYRRRQAGVSKVSGNVRASVRAGVRILGAVVRTRMADQERLR